MATGDFNGDGVPDLVVANPNLNTISVLLGNTTAKTRGTFAARVDYPTGSSPQSIAVADFDGDGLPDLAVVNGGYYSSNNAVSVFLNTTAKPGVFQAKTDFTTGYTPRSVVAGEFNGDGFPDLAVSNYNDSTVSVLLNNPGMTGSQEFMPKVDYAVGSSPGKLVAADLNGDGLGRSGPSPTAAPRWSRCCSAPVTPWARSAAGSTIPRRPPTATLTRRQPEYWPLAIWTAMACPILPT